LSIDDKERADELYADIKDGKIRHFLKIKGRFYCISKDLLMELPPGTVPH
jgi:hypothetical protein